MIGHTQLYPDRTAGDGREGDCWRTAVACLLDMPDPLAVPHFIALDGWWESTVAWVEIETQGRWTLGAFDPVFPIYVAPDLSPQFVIGTGPSPRGDFLHAVIVSALDGELIWDPHPSRAGLAGPLVDIAVLL